MAALATSGTTTSMRVRFMSASRHCS
jgi:hypothetical protein